MAAMKFIVKFFPEITIKGASARGRFVSRLTGNVRHVLGEIDPDISIQRDWDKLVISSNLPRQAAFTRLVDGLSRCSGIACFLDVFEHPLGDFDDMLEQVLAIYRERLAGKTFAVRCKRSGRHDFRSPDVERHLGTGLLRQTSSAGVDLSNPQVTVQLEIRDERLFVVNRRYQGMGGFPAGSLGPVLSLVSGGFDSTLASHQTMKRGLLTHFCLFRLGGSEHELRVKEMALYLWMKYGSSHPVKFVTVPFEEVAAELLTKVQDSQMGVVLKRLMLRAATRLAGQLKIDALVTGESVAQVSSQTLRNLAVIDSATNTLVLRPLISMDKNEIIRQATAIGVEKFALGMPEYCGVISVNPTTRASEARVTAAERQFDFSVLERCLAQARVEPVQQLANRQLEQRQVEVLMSPLADSVVIDIRHPTQAELQPLRIEAPVQNIPFYELHSRVTALDANKVYLLYCDRGVISKLHAGHLIESGFDNIKVYRPRAAKAEVEIRRLPDQL